MGINLTTNLNDEENRVLLDPQQQRGISWRQAKITAIASALARNVPEIVILRRLIVCGLRESTARNLIDAGHVAYEDKVVANQYSIKDKNDDERSEAEKGAEMIDKINEIKAKMEQESK